MFNRLSILLISNHQTFRTAIFSMFNKVLDKSAFTMFLIALKNNQLLLYFAVLVEKNSIMELLREI